MITGLKVDGFRSLLNFSMDFAPGLNVLVGPNGSGKTNIIDALTFIRNFVSSNLHTAVSKSGGSQSVFSIESFSELGAEATFSITGLYKVDLDRSARLGGRRRKTDFGNAWMFFEYTFTATLKKKNAFLGASDQRLRFKFYSKRPKKFPKRLNSLRWDFDLKSRLNLVNRLKHEIISLNEDLFEKYYFLRPLLSSERERRGGMPTAKKRLENNLSYDKNSENSVLYLLTRYIYIMRDFYNEIVSLNDLNISPRIAKRPNDIAEDFGIEANGAGLSATIFRLTKDGRIRPNKSGFGALPMLNGKELLYEISKYKNQLNGSILDVKAKTSNDYLQNIIYLTIKTKGGKVDFPISKVSDGTAKWLALMAYIVINKSNYMIEEPENFLHPSMQRFLVSVIRNIFPDDLSFAVLSTHSETLLNSCHPEELIVVDYKRGTTKIRRIKNPEKLEKIINETGFGLGKYYVAGAFDE